MGDYLRGKYRCWCFYWHDCPNWVNIFKDSACSDCIGTGHGRSKADPPRRHWNDGTTTEEWLANERNQQLVAEERLRQRMVERQRQERERRERALRENEQQIVEGLRAQQEQQGLPEGQAERYFQEMLRQQQEQLQLQAWLNVHNPYWPSLDQYDYEQLVMQFLQEQQQQQQQQQQ